MINLIMSLHSISVFFFVFQFILPGTDLLYEPELYVTVIAHTPLLKCTTNQVGNNLESK